MKVDLHCHTNLSDCSHSFEEIVELAVKEGVTHLAITNHDTTLGLVQMVEQGKAKGVEIIPGIEISAYDFARNRRVHVLGYYVQPGHPAIDRICSPLIERRHQASAVMVQTLIEAGYELTWEQVMSYAKGGTGVYKQHIMHALIEKGYTTSIYGDLYKKLFSRGQNGEKPGIAYIPLEYVTAKDAIAAIRQANGIPVLAHPGQYGSFEAVPELVEFGLEGIEVWHPLHDTDAEDRAKQLAVQYDLIMTGGTDFHGFYGEKEVVLGEKCPGLSAVHALQARQSIIAEQPFTQR
ncbi:PHP domain-containing protein [Brevibacillus choshinensis]|uniref:PHP domain-containing protein n=1 Tax=Brevibacillus choshinensis TaxID=54911 RepID=A0ABX7FUN7_BRECH|nr:PHP domain-containing protein [Brevibacillus choshinensis]QRG69066.1 PHP domain-containing protein [Brevibacillus choshinensis]